MLAITFDVDWAPDPIVREIVAILGAHRVPATFYCTDYTRDASGMSSNLASLLDGSHELALHPDFQHAGDYGRVWDELVALYPSAKGWRSHNGVTGWPITRGGVSRGLLYEVLSPVFGTYVAPCLPNRALKGYYVFTTSFWDSHMLHAPQFSWSPAELPHRELFERDDSLVVLGFHPNIVYYDMRSIEEYDRRKASYHQVDESASFHARPARGAMKLLAGLLDSVAPRHFTTPLGFGAQAGFW
jgi:hypothetical protein